MKHKHQCPTCKMVWQHDPADIKPGEPHRIAHTCPVPGCGGEDIWMKCGNECGPARYCHNGSTTAEIGGQK